MVVPAVPACALIYSEARQGGVIVDFDFLKEERPWSKREINELGEYFAGLADITPEAAEMIFWHDELARRLAAASEEFARDLFGREGSHPDIVSSYRVKSQSTIGDKIRRSQADPSAKMQLGRMWDFAGARITSKNLLDSMSKKCPDITSWN